MSTKTPKHTSPHICYFLGLALFFIATLTLWGQAPASSGTVITIAGSSHGYSGDGGPATNAQMGDGVWAMDFGSDGTLYFADLYNWRIRAIDPVTGSIRTVAGNGILAGDGLGPGDGGPATNASFGDVLGLAVDRTRGVLYFSDAQNNRLRKVDLTTGIISAFAGKGLFGGYGFAGDGGPALDAEFSEVRGLAIDRAGRVFICDSGNYRIRPVDPVTQIISTFAGTGDFFHPPCSNAGDGGPAINADFSLPVFAAADGGGNIFVFDGGGPCGEANPPTTIRRIDAVSGIITRVVGGGTNALGNGVATNMDLAQPPVNSHTVDRAGNVYIATYTRVFKLDPVTGLLSVYAGTGIQGNRGDGGPAIAAEFARIYALFPAPGGGLVVADSGSARLRYIAPDSISLTNDSGQTSFTLPWVSALTGDFILENNPNLTNVSGGTLTTVGGTVSIGGNSAASVVDLGSLLSAGTVSITNNPLAGIVSLGALGSVTGEVTITDNTGASTIDLGSLTNAAGPVSIGGNTSASEVDLGSLGAAGSVSITDNTAAETIGLGSLGTVAGEVTISGNTAAASVDLGALTNAGGAISIGGNTAASEIDLGSLSTASGDVTIESNAANAVVSLGLTNYGCGASEVTLTLDGGTVEVTNGLTLCTNATLTGSTTMDGSVTNNGTIEPGSSPGRLNITGNLYLAGASRLALEIGGYASDESDVVNVGGNVTLGGTLTIRLLNNFTNVMTNGTSFTVLTAGAPLAGSFANVASGGTLVTAEGRGRFTVHYAGENTLRLTDLEILNGGNADTDGDGMPDLWEEQFGLDKTLAGDAALDLDGDGSLNRAEYLAGTRPNDPASVFRISIAHEATAVRITWSTVGGKSYRVQTNAPAANGGITSNFVDFSPLITTPGTTESTTNVIDTPPAGEARFYRVRVAP